MKRELVNDHAILINALILMQDKGQAISEEAVYHFFNNIKAELDQEAIAFKDFAEIVNDLMKYTIISIEEGVITLEDYVWNKTSIHQIYEDMNQ